MIFLIANRRNIYHRWPGRYNRKFDGLTDFHNFQIHIFSASFRMGIGSLLEVMQEHELENTDNSDNDANDNEDYNKKLDSAEDFSDINELAEDLQSAMQVRRILTRILRFSIIFWNRESNKKNLLIFFSQVKNQQQVVMIMMILKLPFQLTP